MEEEEEEEDREYSGWLVAGTDWSNYQPLTGPVKQSMELQFLRLIVSILASAQTSELNIGWRFSDLYFLWLIQRKNTWL